MAKNKLTPNFFLTNAEKNDNNEQNTEKQTKMQTKCYLQLEKRQLFVRKKTFLLCNINCEWQGTRENPDASNQLKK